MSVTTTTDRRVRRTRAALRAALLDLMAERRYETVSVQDTIDRADVGRSTFYNHYTDKDDLLRDGLADLRAIVTTPPGRTGMQPLDFALPLLHHVHEQRRLANALLGEGGRAVLRQIERVLTDTVRDALTAVGSPAVPVPHEARARFIVGAFLSLLEWWLTDQPDVSPQQLGRMFHSLAAPGLTAAAG